jgi:hypothetical protein
MNTYEIRVTNTQDDNDFCTHKVQSTSLGAINCIIEEAINVSDKSAEFETPNGKFINIYEASDEGYMYDIWLSKDDYMDDTVYDPDDGGQCTSTLSNAIEMALSQA